MKRHRRSLFVAIPLCALLFGAGSAQDLRVVKIPHSLLPREGQAIHNLVTNGGKLKYHSRVNSAFHGRMMTDSRFDRVDTIRVLVLRAEFQPDASPLTTGDGRMDYKGFLSKDQGLLYDPPHTRVYFEKLMQSLHNFYMTNSLGKCFVTYRVFPDGLTDAYQLPHNMLYYGDTTSTIGVETGLTRLMRDCIKAADSDPAVHFADYDHDHVVIFHAGSTIQSDPNYPPVHPFDLLTGSINDQALQAYLGQPFILADEGRTKVTAASIIPEMARNDTMYQGETNILGMTGVEGLLYHEFNHLLGGLDLYDVTYYTQGVGAWSLMGEGGWLGDWGLGVPPGTIPSMLDAWHKVYNGWVKPLVVNLPRESIPIFAAEMETSDFARRADSLHPVIVKVPISSSEYFLIENRQTEVAHRDTLIVHVEEGVPVSVADGEYDFFQPGSGILIWHIDESVIALWGPLNMVNVDAKHKGVKLVEGDGIQDFDMFSGKSSYDYQIYGSKDDPFFVGGYNDSLNDHTVPNSDGYYGKTFMSIGVLSGLDSVNNSDTVMPVSVGFGLNQPGFPQDPGLLTPYNPATCADLNQNGHSQFVVSDTGGRIFAWNPDGTTFLASRSNGFFVTLPGTSTHSAVTAGDITGDKALEVLCAADNHRLYAYTAQGGLAPGFPVQTNDRLTATPVLCDLDQDGKKEIVVGSTDGNLYAWKGDGHSLAGFPLHLGSELRAAAAITDLQHPQIAVLGSDGKLFLVNPDGTMAPGFPSDLSTGSLYTYAAPVIGDLDHDGQREIVCAVSGGYDYKLVVVGLDGKVRYQSRAQVRNPFYGTPALADLNSDGNLEAVLAAKNSVYAFNFNGTLVSNYPIEQESTYEKIEIGSLPEGDYLFDVPFDFDFSSSPVVADLDASGVPSIVVGSPKWGVLLFNARTGRQLTWSPLSTLAAVSPTPLICDADQDGKLEIAAGSDDGAFHVWKLPGNPQSPIPNPQWGQFLRDQDHTGLYSDTLPLPGNTGPKIVRQFYVYPNPAEKMATARYSLGRLTNTSVRIKVLDVSGRPLIDVASAPAVSSADNEQQFNTVAVPTGVYLIKLEVKSDQGRAVKFYKLGVAR